MNTASNLRLTKGHSRDELIVKFNLVSQNTENNTQAILDINKKIDKVESNIINKINESNIQINKRISNIEIKDKIDDIKYESSFSNFFNIGFKSVLLKIIEYGILAGMIYVSTHIKN